MSSSPGIGWAGAGAFSTGTLLPAFRAAGFDRFVAVASASGLSARRAAERHGFEKAVPGADALLDDPGVQAVVIATPHDTHAELAARALAAGRHVWCEKPLALTEDELDAVEKAWRESGAQLAIGFNRRWSPAVLTAQRALAGIPAPRSSWCTGSPPGPCPTGTGTTTAGRAAACSARSAISSIRRRPWWASRSRKLPDCQVAADPEDSTGTTARSRSASPTGPWPRSPTAARRRWPGRNGSRSRPGSHRLVIDDFRSVQADGKTVWKGRQDKGHHAEATAFRQAVAGGPAMPTETLLATMRATIQAAADRRP